MPGRAVPLLDRSIRPTEIDHPDARAYGRLRGLSHERVIRLVSIQRFAGLDLEALNRYEPYHALMAEAAESAIGAGIGVVDLGRSNGPIKQRYGASGHPLYLAVRAHSPADQALLHAWCADLER